MTGMDYATAFKQASENLTRAAERVRLATDAMCDYDPDTMGDAFDALLEGATDAENAVGEITTVLVAVEQEMARRLAL